MQKNRILFAPIIFILIAFIIIGTKLGYPYQRTWAFVVLTLSWIPIAVSYYINRKFIRVNQIIIAKKTKPFAPHLIVALILIVAIYVANILAPKYTSQLTKMSNQELVQNIQNDFQTYQELCMAIDVNIDMFETTGLLQKDVTTLSVDEKAQLKELWYQGLMLFLECNVLKEKYSGFYLIDYNEVSQLHSDAFFLEYATYIAQYEACMKLYQMVNDNEFMETFLNEKTENIPEKTFFAMKQILFNPTVALRTNAGSGYYQLVKQDISFDNVTKLDFEKRNKNFFKIQLKNPQNFIDNPLDILEETATEAWLPLQKEVAVKMSYIRTAKRDYHINPEIINQHQAILEPGDIMFQRRNWHMTNIGIPGFWPHTALYIGSLDELTSFFGEDKVKQLQKEYPEVCKMLNSRDENSYPYSVIEAIRPGVVIQSFQKSANCDYLAVVRADFSKQQKFEIVRNAFKHYQKPYDLNFDFTTDNELVCSELIYKAYAPVNSEIFQTEINNGRPLLPPNQMAKQVATNSIFKTILFIDSSEKEKKAFNAPTENFTSTPYRPKWDILQK